MTNWFEFVQKNMGKPKKKNPLGAPLTFAGINEEGPRSMAAVGPHNVVPKRRAD
jgi:hypothetical protein